jgi:hypothetical protein
VIGERKMKIADCEYCKYYEHKRRTTKGEHQFHFCNLYDKKINGISYGKCGVSYKEQTEKVKEVKRKAERKRLIKCITNLEE